MYFDVVVAQSTKLIRDPQSVKLTHEQALAAESLLAFDVSAATNFQNLCSLGSDLLLILYHSLLLLLLHIICCI